MQIFTVLRALKILLYMHVFLYINNCILLWIEERYASKFPQFIIAILKFCGLLHKSLSLSLYKYAICSLFFEVFFVHLISTDKYQFNLKQNFHDGGVRE